jgi:hypothetical protein
LSEEAGVAVLLSVWREETRGERRGVGWEGEASTRGGSDTLLISLNHDYTCRDSRLKKAEQTASWRSTAVSVRKRTNDVHILERRTGRSTHTSIA